MPLFDNIKNKTLQAAQAAADKTKLMMEVSKLNGVIDEEKKRINSSLMRIGEICYENHPENVSALTADLVEQINSSKTKIEDYSKQINKLKGVAKCEQCGAEVVQYDKPFCSNCGASMSIEPENQAPENGKACGGCATIVAPDVAFCTNCGHKLDS